MNCKTPLLYLFLFSWYGLQAQIDVSGTISVDSTWTLTESPVTVTSNLTIAQDVTLTIEPGVVIKFSDTRFSYFTVNGTLDAQGTSALPIVFTSYSDDSYGGDSNGDGSATSPAAGQWRTITFNETSANTSIMDYCLVRYGGFDRFDDTKAIRIVNSSPSISNSTFFQNSLTMIIEGENAAPILTNNTFEEDTGIATSMDINSNPVFSGNQLVNCLYTGLGLNGKTFTGSLTLPKRDAFGVQNIPYLTVNNIAIAEESTLTIDPGVVIKALSFRNSIWSIYGTLTAIGTLAEPIVFTSLYDDSNGGDTNNNADANVPGPGQWRSIVIYESSGNTSIMDHCQILYGGYDYFDNTKAVRIVDSSPTITNSRFYKNSISLAIEGFSQEIIIIDDEEPQPARMANTEPVISNNIFEEDTWAPIIMDIGVSPVFMNNTFVNNTYNAVGLSARTYSEENYTLPQLDIAGFQNIAYITSGNIAIAAGSTLTIDPGIVIKGTSFRNSIWTISGTLLAQGTIADPIVFTSFYDDTYGGDTNNNADANAPGPGQWRSLVFSETSTNSILDHCLIRYGGYDYFDNTRAIQINNSSPTITNTSFYQNSIALGIAGTTGTPSIANNSFEEDTWAPIMMDLGAMPEFINNVFLNNAYNAVGITDKAYNESNYTLPKLDIADFTNISYITSGNISIGSETTLTIEPGIVIKATNTRNSYWTINGTLLAQGTIDEPIIFTSLHDDSFGGDTNNNADATSPSAGQWRAIVFAESSESNSILDHCHIRYGGYDRFDNTKAIIVQNSSPTITNNTFYNNSISIGIEGTSATPVIDNNSFEEDTWAPIMMDLGAMPIFSNTTFINNTYNAVGITEKTYSEPNYVLPKLDIAGFQNIAYITTGNIAIGSGATLTIEPGIVIKATNTRNSYWTINGTLVAQGTAADPIVFTSIHDDTFGGDTNNNADATSPAPGQWRAITFNESSGNTSIIDHCEIRFGGHDWFDNIKAISIQNSSPTITNTHFYQNSIGLGIVGLDANPIISDNSFEEDIYAPIAVDLGVTPSFQNNNYVNNTFNAISINNRTYTEDSLTLVKQDVAGLSNVAYIIGADLTISSNTRLEIEPGVVIKFVDLNDSYFRIDGTLIAEGTAAEPIVFTEIDDDEFGGDTNNNGDATLPAVRNWQGIVINSPDSIASSLDYCEIRYGGYSGDEAVMINNSSPTITNSHFYRNGEAIAIRGITSSPQITNNIFEEDTYAPIVMGLGSSPVFSGIQYVNNTYNAIGINAATYSEPSYTLSKQDISGFEDIAYIINADLTISAGSSLTIDPGVIIKFIDFNDSYFRIDGTLLAQGTEAEPIVFTEIDDDEYGGDTNNNGTATVAEPRNWQGIIINESSGNTSVIDQCFFRYGGYSGDEAIMIVNSEPVISNNHFYQNGIGVSINGYQNSPQITNNIFEEDTFAPVQISLGAEPSFTGNTFTNNTYDAIALITTTYSDPTYQLSRRTIAGIQNLPYIIGADLTLAAGSTLTIDPGVVIKFTDFNDSYIRINGTLIAQGIESDPIIFTEIDDDTFGGDTNNNGTDTSPALGNWQGIAFNADSGNTSLVDYCQFRYGGYSGEEAIMIFGSNPTITNSLFYQNGGGIRVSATSDLTLANNSFEENSFALQNLIDNATLFIEESSFINNQKGIVNEASFLEIHNSSLLDNTVYDIENLDAGDVQAQNNWWGEDDYALMELDNDTLNFPFIFDKLDDDTRGVVFYYPPMLPDTVSVPQNIPDLEIQNIVSGITNAEPGDVVTVNWDLTNIGEGIAVVDWTEKVYIQAPDGSNRVLVGQINSVADDTLSTNEVFNHSLEVTLPNPINVGATGVFAVEVVPTANVGEPVLLEGNNTAVEAQTWSVEANVVLEIIAMEIEEGGSAITANITRNGSTDANLIVDISITDAFRFDIPAQVEILAGLSGLNFTITALDNQDLEGPLPIEVSVSATGFVASIDSLVLIDDEIPELSIDDLPASIEEGEMLNFNISTNFPPADTLFVSVLSSEPTDLPLATPVKILPGESSVAISVILPDNDIAEEDQLITITAGSAGLISATESILLIDENDIPAISFTVAVDTISESAGIFATQGILTRLGSTDDVLSVDISANLSNALYLPATVPLGPGEMQKTFDIGVLDNNNVDGFRDVEITASVIIESCNCLASATSAGVFSDILTIADNDGASLSLQVNPLSLPEGEVNAGVLTVIRNTPADVALTVSLSSSDESEITLPATVTLPIGAVSIDVPITTIQDNIPDGNQQVNLTANADNFSPGIAFAIVTDINKPDLEAADLILPESSVPAGDNFQFRLSLANSGLANAPIGTNIRAYLSLDPVISDEDLLITDFCIPQAVPQNDTLEIIDFALAPDEPGNYFFIAIVNAEQSITEIQYFNNTSIAVPILIEPDYDGTAVVDETIFLQGMNVPIYGTSIDDEGNNLANVPLEVYVTDGMFRRELMVTTDDNGEYATSFQPLPNEGGHYIVGASYPGINSNIVQDEFDILGVALNANEDIRWEFLLGDTLRGSLDVENLSDFPLTNINISAIGLPFGANISFESITALAAKETVQVAYEVSGTEVSPGLQFQTVELLITSDENIQQELDAYYLCQAQAGLIRSSIARIDRTISNEESNFLEFELFNEGLGESGAITIDIPGVDFMSLVSLDMVPSISSGDTTRVIIEFLPTASLPLNTPATGTIVISAENSNFIVLPYKVQKVSEETGGVIIDVVDQYTYFTEESPHVANASVKITNYFTGEVFAEGTTDANGLFDAQDLPEGLLRIVVQADQHAGYDGTITILPGMDFTETIFLSYQAISFSWDVVPTTIEDEYQVDLIMEFETNVPMPVVTIDAPKELPELFGNDTYSFNVTLVNEGLITARDVELNLPSDAEYEFITNYVPTDLLAQQAIQVPVIMRRIDAPGFAAEDEKAFKNTDEVSDFLGTTNRIQNMGLNCVDVFTVAYWYECGPNGVWQYGGESTVFLGRFCSSPGSFNPTGSPCSNCPPSSGLNPTPVATGPTNCLNLDCLRDVLLAAVGCGPEPYLAAAACGISVGTTFSDPNSSNGAKAVSVLGCVPGPIGCAFGILGAANTCFDLGLFLRGNDSGKVLKGLEEDLAETDLPPIIQQALVNLEQATFGYSAHQSYYEEYVGISLYANENVLAFAELILPFVEQEIEITTTDANDIIASLVGYDIPVSEIDDFILRWNESLVAYQNNVFSPNASYPTIIDRTLLDQYYADLQAAHNYAINRGFLSIVDMHDQAVKTILEEGEDDDASVCASVTIQISQEVTLTREAFEGTLGVLNGHPTDMIDSLELNLEIVNPQGVLSNDLFQIELIGLDKLTAIDGTGTLNAQEDGTATILFIPEIGAAPTVPISYSFGGSISYKDPFSNLIVTVPLFPVTLQVNPSPNLYLHYFMDRDLLGDDALTDPIEPTVPGELAVMIENNGYGTAMGVNIESAQPEIIDNEKGLAINFKLIGTQLQGEEANLGITNINFGDISPLSTKVGQWFFTSSLLGHFINYETNLVHLNSYGNPDLSLISGVELHELIQTISVYTQDDGIDDFLINDIQDPEERPDAIYLSQGNTVYDVYEAEAGYFTGDLLAAGNTNTVHVDPSLQGWNYIKLDDPGNGNFEILSVTRSDGQEIPLTNVWLTFVTIPDSKEPVYENKFHIVDEFAGFDEVTYDIIWSTKDPNPPYVANISGYPNGITSEQVESLTVTFSEAIDETTFGIEDLNLIVQGGSNIIDNSVLITRVDSVTFDIDISAVSTANGLYIFTVQTTGINDLTATAGEVGEQISWTQFLSVPSVVQFIGLPEGNIGNAYDTIQLLFNMPLDINSLTADRFTILLDGVPQTGVFTVSSLNNQNTLIELAGIDTHLGADGVYELIVDLPNIQSQDGMFGIGTQSVFFELDTAAPSLVNLLRYVGGGLDDQHFTGVNMNFNEDIMPLDIAALSLTKDGVVVDISDIPTEVVSVNDWYAIESFGQLTYDEADYVFSIDMSLVSDSAGNPGVGVEQTSWTVDRTNSIIVSDLTIQPDLGFSSTDGVTSSLDLMIGYTINDDAETVNIYQDDNGTLTLLSSMGPIMAGVMTTPVQFPTGGNTALVVEALDDTGFSVDANKSLYLDETSLTASWDFEDGLALNAHPSVITLEFSDAVLDDSQLASALFLNYENNILSTDDLVVNSISETTYEVSGFESTTLLDGVFTIGLDVTQFYKYQSGLQGTDVNTTSWVIETPIQSEISVKLIDSLDFCFPGTGPEPFVTIIAIGSGGSGMLTYSWDNDLGLGPIKEVSPEESTVYRVTVSDNFTGVSSIDSVLVNVVNCSEDITCENVMYTDVTCYGLADGTITIETGPVSQYDFSIFPGLGTNNGDGSFTNLPSGAYTVLASDETSTLIICAQIFIAAPQPISCDAEFGCEEVEVVSSGWVPAGTRNYRSNLANGAQVNMNYTTESNSTFMLVEANENFTTWNSDWFSGAIAGASASRFQYVWDLLSDAQGEPIGPNDDSDNVIVTIVFDEPVSDPIIHIDRLGGVTTSGQSNSSNWRLLSEGTLEKLAGTDNLMVSDIEFFREIKSSGILASSEAQSNPDHGAAAGSIQINTLSPVSSISFELSAKGYEGNGSDDFELIVSTTSCEGEIDENLIFVTAPGASDGSIQVTATGGSGNYSFALLPEAGSHDGNGLFTNLPVGSYTVQVSDNGQCTLDCLTFEVLDEHPFSCEAIANLTTDVCVDEDAITIYSKPVAGEFRIDGDLDSYDIQFSNMNREDLINTILTDDQIIFDLTEFSTSDIIVIKHKTKSDLYIELLIE